MKSKLIISGISFVASLSGFGAIYNVTTGTVATSNGIAPSGFQYSNPSAAAAGNYTNGYQSPGSAGVVAFGIFSSLSDAQITGAAISLSTLYSNFNIFGSAGTFNAAGAFGTMGVFARSTSATVTGSIFSGKNIYAFAGNGSTFANSTELLVLKSASLFSDAQDAIPTAQAVTLTTANTELLFGLKALSVKTTTADSSATPGWNTAIAVPEPSAALLGALGALGLLRRRRN